MHATPKAHFSATLLLVLFFLGFSSALSPSIKIERASKLKVLASYGKLPLSFIENRGQVREEAFYYVKGRQGSIYFTREGIVYDLFSDAVLPPKAMHNTETRRLSFTLKLTGANEGVMVIGLNELPGKAHYFIGNDPEKWQTGIPIYEEIVYKGPYTGIDLKVYGTTNQMEYDFIVSPGANPKDIKMTFEGIDALSVDKNGDLLIHTPIADIRHSRPLLYQEIGGERHHVGGSFRIAQNTVDFDIGAYNKNHSLIIDPVTLSYAAFLGATSDDLGYGIAVDSSGSAYVTGSTLSTDFPTQNAYQGKFGGYQDAFVTKLSPSGTTLSYSTFLGGAFPDYGYGIAVDASGNAYVMGKTYSSDFPTHNAYQGTFGGGWDAFVTKLSPNGTTLSYSTFLGGTDSDWGRSITVDASGSAYVTGKTYSSDFPTHNAYQGTFAGAGDAFVTKLSPGGTILFYSTFLGGTKDDWAHDIAVDASGSAYVTGHTRSSDFPTHNAYQRTFAGVADAFVTKMSPSGTTLSYSTFLGGTDDDYSYGIAVDASGSAYVTGFTESPDFPTHNAYLGTWVGNRDAFVTKLSPGGTTLSYSTFLGGTDDDYSYGIAMDVSGSAYVTGYTESRDFPTHDAFQATFGGNRDAFVTELSPNGTALSYSTFLGGSDGDYGCGVAVDAWGNAYVTGFTGSSDFPYSNAYQRAFTGAGDAFVIKFRGRTMP